MVWGKPSRRCLLKKPGGGRLRSEVRRRWVHLLGSGAVGLQAHPLGAGARAYLRSLPSERGAQQKIARGQVFTGQILRGLTCTLGKVQIREFRSASGGTFGEVGSLFAVFELELSLSATPP